MYKARTVLVALALVAGTAMAASASALAAVVKASKHAVHLSHATNTILADCEHHNYQLTGHYTVAALRSAYDHIPTVTREYTTCASVIYNQLQTQLGGHLKAGGSSSGGFPWIIVVIVVIVVLGAGGAFWAYRRNRQDGPVDPSGPASAR